MTDITIQFDKVSVKLPRELLQYHAESLLDQHPNVGSSPITLTGPENPQALTILGEFIQLIGASKRGHKDPPLSSNLLEDQYQWNGKADFELCAWMRKTFPYPAMKDAKSKTERPYSPEKMDEFMRGLIKDVIILTERLQMKHLMRVLAVYFTLCQKLSQDRTPKPVQAPVVQASSSSVSMSQTTAPMDTS